MYKFSLLTTLFLLIGLFAKAENTDLSLYDNVLYAESQSCAAGESFTLSVKMKNSIAIAAFQFDLELPDGITVAKDADDFYLISLSTERTSAQKTNFFDNALQKDGSVRVLAASTQNYTFSGNDGEVATITINVANTVADGEYPIVLKNIVLSDTAAKTYEAERIEATLTVGNTSPSYAEGFSVQMLPFLFTKDAEPDILLTNATAVKTVDFDIELPSNFITNEAYYIDAQLAKKNYTTSDDLDGSTVHVSIAGKSSNTLASGENEAIATLGLTFEEAALSNGVYPVTIKNIVMTDADGTTYQAAPFTTSIFVGQYSRSVQYEWGTVCLPYTAKSTDALQLYTLSSVAADGATLNFVPASSVAANTPCVFKASGSVAEFPVEADAEAENSTFSAETSVPGWNICGTYCDQTLTPGTKNIYYISENKFWYADEAFSVPAFRCWFEVSDTVGAKVLSISETEKANTTPIKFVENNDNSVSVVFDLEGRKLAQPQHGLNIVNGKKVIVK